MSFTHTNIDWNKECFKWNWVMGTYNRTEVAWATQFDDWQSVRIRLKGQRTSIKLGVLDQMMRLSVAESHAERVRTKVCVTNYINALKRGGQLNMNLEVIK